jgi:hypothetical protein
MKGMMQKKYLLVSLLAAAALLTGCSDSGTDTEKAPDSSTSVRSDGLTNPSIPEPRPVSTKTLEDGAMEVVKIPESITGDKDFVPVTFPSTSGSVVETDTDVTVVYNDTFDKETVHKWIGELEAKGWEVSPIDTLESPTSYNTVLSKDHKMISLYSANTDKTKNTVISFSK